MMFPSLSMNLNDKSSTQIWYPFNEYYHQPNLSKPEQRISTFIRFSDHKGRHSGTAKRKRIIFIKLADRSIIGQIKNQKRRPRPYSYKVVERSRYFSSLFSCYKTHRVTFTHQTVHNADGCILHPLQAIPRDAPAP